MWLLSLALTSLFLLGIGVVHSDHDPGSMRAVGYETVPATWSVGSAGTMFWEISGLARISNTELYAVSDTILQSFPKQLFLLNLNGTTTSTVAYTESMVLADPMTGITLMEPSSNLDTESVAYYMNGAEEARYVVVNEGYRQWAKNTSFVVYNQSGGLESMLTFDLWDSYVEQGTYDDSTGMYSVGAMGFQEGHGFEGVSITADSGMLFAIGSNTLLQDLTACPFPAVCVRLLNLPLQDDAYGNPMAMPNIQAQYLYETTRPDDVDNATEVFVVDVAVVDTAGEVVLVMESYEIAGAMGYDNQTTWNISVYAAFLGIDVATSFTADTIADAIAVPKELLYNFLTQLPNDLNYADAGDLDFDAIVVMGEEGTSGVCLDTEALVVAVTDNSETEATVFVYLCYTMPEHTDATTGEPSVDEDGAFSVLGGARWMQYVLAFVVAFVAPRLT